jgi:hypothetical protein
LPPRAANAATAPAAYDTIDAMDLGRSGAVALVCALLVVVTGCTTAPDTSAAEAGDADRAVPVVLAGAPAGTVPSVFGHTRDTAETLLRETGLDVRFGKQVGCDPAGRPVATEPATGTAVQPGDSVTVLLSYQAATTDCAADLSEPWRVVDFATGRGPAPRFADEVSVHVDGRPTGTTSGADAARGGGATGTALDVLGRATELVLRTGDAHRMPQLQVITGTPPDTWCGIARPPDVAGREALTITIDFAEVTATPRCPARVALFETAGAIDTVVAWSEGARGNDLEPIPDVVGLPLTEARDRVTAAGYPARVEEHETCQPRRGVVEQAPTQSAVEQDAGDDPGWYGPVTLVVEVPHTVRDCAALDAAARGFVRFAQGGPPPAWAPEVQQLLGYTPWATVAAAAADDPATWSLCSGSAPQDCEVSPLVVAGRAGEVGTGEFADVTRLPDGQTCELIDRGGLPSGLSVDRQVVMYPASPTSCDDDWAVWLWVDDDGRITTVNLLVPE